MYSQVTLKLIKLNHTQSFSVKPNEEVYSELKEIKVEVPQGNVLGPRMRNIPILIVARKTFRPYYINYYFLFRQVTF